MCVFVSFWSTGWMSYHQDWLKVFPRQSVWPWGAAGQPTHTHTDTNTARRKALSHRTPTVCLLFPLINGSDRSSRKRFEPQVSATWNPHLWKAGEKRALAGPPFLIRHVNLKRAIMCGAHSGDHAFWWEEKRQEKVDGTFPPGSSWHRLYKQALAQVVSYTFASLLCLSSHMFSFVFLPFLQQKRTE